MTGLDFFSLIAYQDLKNSEFSFLLSPSQKEVIADMINDIIVQNLGNKTQSDLEKKLEELNSLQTAIREKRNNLGEVFQFRLPK